MTSMDRIQELASRIAEEFAPERIILFGSHARGDAGKYSDVDLLVIMPVEGNCLRKAAEMRIRLRPGFRVHLVVRRPEVVEERIALGDFFLREAVEEGRVLYDSPRSRVGREG